MAFGDRYTQGTVSTDTGSPADPKKIIGHGTLWSVTAVADDLFWSGAASVPIASVDGDTQLTLAADWPGSALDHASYSIEFLGTSRYEQIAVADQQRKLLNSINVYETICPTFSVKTFGVNDPPGDVVVGDRFVIATGTGTFAGHNNEIVEKTTTGWLFTEPEHGWQIVDQDEHKVRTWTGSAWEVVAGPGDVAGPSSSTANNLAAFDGATGKLLKDSGLALDTDGTLAANSDTKLASQKAVKTYVGSGAAVHAATGKTAPVDADEIGIIDSAASNVLKALTWANLKAALKAYFNFREVLTADRTYYVRPDGSDGNDGLSNTSGGAFLTLQKAINVVAALDISIYNVTIQVGAGTYTGTVTVNGPWVGKGTVTLSGDTTTPSNVLISTSGNCITVQSGATLSIKGFKFTSSAGLALIYAKQYGVATLSGKNEFGASTHDLVADTGTILAVAPEIVSGTTAGGHYYAQTGGIINCANATWTASVTAAFGVAFVFAQATGVVFAFNNTSSGTFTGARYSAQLNSVITTNGGGANYFPGSSAGATSTGGQFA